MDGVGGWMDGVGGWMDGVGGVVGWMGGVVGCLKYWLIYDCDFWGVWWLLGCLVVVFAG